jgi:hypothetical protein
MNLKEFKEMVNAIDPKYDELEVWATHPEYQTMWGPIENIHGPVITPEFQQVMMIYSPEPEWAKDDRKEAEELKLRKPIRGTIENWMFVYPVEGSNHFYVTGDIYGYVMDDRPTMGDVPDGMDMRTSLVVSVTYDMFNNPSMVETLNSQYKLGARYVPPVEPANLDEDRVHDEHGDSIND